MWRAPAELSPAPSAVVVVAQATTFTTGQVSVTTNTPVLAANPKRVAATFKNDEIAGAADIFLHAPGGSVTTGLKLFAGPAAGDGVRILTQQAISASATAGGPATISFIEEVTP